jgi:K+-dependent Na+/Ca+ exchanger-like protein
VSPDVAGATFMAAGSSAPELFTALVATFLIVGSGGVGTIIGSAIFNVLVIVGVTSYVACKDRPLTIWKYPLVRDTCWYSLSILELVCILADDEVKWYESLIMILTYVGYIVYMMYNAQIVQRLPAHWQKPGQVDEDEGELLARPVTIGHGLSEATPSSEALGEDPDPPASGRGGVTRVALKRFYVGSLSLSQRRKWFWLPFASKARERIASLRGIPQAKVAPVPSPESAKQSAPADSEEPPTLMLPNAAMRRNLPAVTEAERESNSPTPHHLVEDARHGMFDADSAAAANSLEDANAEAEPTPAEEVREVQVTPAANVAKEPLKPLALTSPWRELGQASGGDEEQDEKGQKDNIFRDPLEVFWELTLPVPDKCWRLFTCSILYIGLCTYLMVDAASRAGIILRIPTLVMGLIPLAAGTSIPDALGSIAVAKQGEGDMAVCNALGSNVFDILLGLGIPWFIKTLFGKEVKFKSGTFGELVVDVIILVLFLFLFLGFALHTSR